MRPFTGKAIVLTLFYVGFWGLVGFITDGPAGLVLFTLTLGPVFAITGVLLMAYDLRPMRAT